MDGIIGGPWTEAQIKTISQQNETREEQQKSKQKSRRKWWKMSRNDKEEQAQDDDKMDATFSSTPSSNDMGYCEGLYVNMVNGIRTVKGTSESMDYSLKFSVNKKPSLDPIDLNVKKHEKKKKRKDKKSALMESSDIYKKSGKSKSAQSPRLQKPFRRSEGPRETPESPTDSEFWGFSNMRSPLNFNVEHALDTCIIVDRPADKVASVSDEEYDAEMAYRFPILYRRLSKLSPQNTSSCDPERRIVTPKPLRHTPEISNAEDIKKAFNMKSPDVVLNHRRGAYIVGKDSYRTAATYTHSQSNVKESDTHSTDKDKSTASISHSIVDTDKSTASISHSDLKGSKAHTEDKATISHNNVQARDEHIGDTHRYTATIEFEDRGHNLVQHSDDLESDIDKLLDELDEIW